MKEWKVRLKGEKFDLLDLSKMLTSNDLNIMEENDSFYLRSLEFNLLSKADDVYSCATEIIRRINLAAKVFVDNFKSVNLDVVTLVHNNGSHQNFIYLSGKAHIQSRTSVVKLDINSEDELEASNQHSALESYISLVKQNPKVERALRYFASKGPRWVNLYKVYEVILEDMGGENIVINNNWVSRTKLRLFRSTADNPRAIGDEARHGHEKWEPPQSPMPLSEAEFLIKNILINWISLKSR